MNTAGKREGQSMKNKLSKADKEAVRVLRYALELIKKGWTREAYAVNKHNTVVEETSSEAVRFCAAGALRRAVADLKKPFSPSYYLDIKLVVQKDLPEGLWLFNDRQKSKRPVIKLFEKAIAHIEGTAA